MRVTLSHAETLHLSLCIPALFQCSRLGNSFFAMCFLNITTLALLVQLMATTLALFVQLMFFSSWPYWSECVIIYFIRFRSVPT